MRIQKPLNLTLLSLFVLLLCLWLARAWIAERLITNWLRDFGMSGVTVDIRRLGPGYSVIEQLGFTLVTDTGRLRLELSNAALEYDLNQLKRGRVNDLAVSSLILEFEQRQAPTREPTYVDTALEPLAVIAGLRRALREYVVFDSFLVQQATLRGDAFGVLQNRPLYLDGTNDRKSTSAELTIGNPNAPEVGDGSRKILLSQLSEDRIIIALPEVEAPTGSAGRLDLAITDTDIDGSYDIEPNALMHWLKPFAQLPEIKPNEPITGTIRADFGSAHMFRSLLTARTDKLVTGTFRTEGLELRLHMESLLDSRFRVISFLENSSISADGLVINRVTIDGGRLGISGNLSFLDDAWQYTGAARTDSLSVQYGPQTVMLDDIAAHLEVSPKTLQVDGRFSPAATSGKFAFTLAHRFYDTSGTLSVKPLEPINLGPEDHRLSQLLTPWSYAFDLLTGNVSMSANGKWHGEAPTRLTATIQLKDSGGHLDEIVFSGLSVDHELEILPEIRSLRTSKISLDHLDSGVTASNISTMLTLKPADTGPFPLVQIQGLHGEIFDGAFSSGDFVFDPNRDRNRFTIAARDIDLAKIVETQQLEDIVVTGRISGTIPVQIDKNRVFIENGAFINDIRTGTIRYNPATGTDQLKQNPLTGIALDALRDFRYSHLSADVNFSPDGMLKVSLKLKGTSPELETERPVHLNINTEQNLLSLLKSLRYAEGISANIDRKVRRQYHDRK